MAQTLNTRIILRNDSQNNWNAVAETEILLKGEVGIEFIPGYPTTENPNVDYKPKMKIGDGVHAWKDLPYFGGEEAHVYEATATWAADDAGKITAKSAALATITATPNTHDVAIISSPIVNPEKVTESVTQKYEITAYRWNGTAWKACDGNYSARNVIFEDDFTFTTKIGTVQTLTNGSATVKAAGKNLTDFFAGIFAKEEYPSTPSTSASITSDNIGAKEVGTKISVNYSFSTSANAYKYGPANGVTFSNYSATFNGETKTSKSGTFAEVQVTDSTSLSITGSCSQSAGVVPKTNIGNDYAAAQIKAKEWTGLSKGTLTGFRNWFCGYKNGDNALADPTAITGAQIRALGNAANGSWVASMDIDKMKQMYFAAPAGTGSKPTVKDAATTAPQTVLGPITVYVKGANEYVASGDETTNGGMAYDVWYVANADAASGSATVNITR